MNKRELGSFALCGMLLALCFSADAQQTKKIHRIGNLSLASPPSNPNDVDAFRKGLRDLGYIEGQNISIEYRWAEGRYERLPDLATELVRFKVDVILAQATPGSLAAMQATKTIPIVFYNVANPVESGLVASLARPGGNITGLTNISLELSGKQLELIKESIPTVTRVAVIWNPANPSHTPRVLRETEIAANALRLQLQLLEVRNPKDLDSAFSTINREHAGAVLILGDPMLGGTDQQRRIADLATKNRLPTIYWLSSFPEAGGLISYGPSNADMYRRAAVYVDKILKGAKPADLPVEQPMKFELVINLKAAKQIGLTIPPDLLARATKIIR